MPVTRNGFSGLQGACAEIRRPADPRLAMEAVAFVQRLRTDSGASWGAAFPPAYERPEILYHRLGMTSKGFAHE